jgi:dTDP-4-dehydrorhamnose 3,5-epimerase
MKIIETKLKDLYIVEPDVFEDERGYFFESYSKKKHDKQLPQKYEFIQYNESKSNYGVLRGLHYQLAPYSQTKLIRVICGKVYDVVVDLRKESATFGEWCGIELSGDDKKQFLIPKGFAHGFVVLSENTIISYSCDEYYNPESERGIMFNDPALGIDWKIGYDEMILSERDKKWPVFAEADMNF